MPNRATLPPIFSQYATRVDYVQQHGDRISSSCPSCGGEPHDEPGRRGEWPDRCVWWDDETPLGKCFQCGTVFWPNAQVGWTPPTPEQLERTRQQREQEAAIRQARAEQELAYFRSQAMWEQYHEMIAHDERGRCYWEQERGFARFWIDWFQFGWRTGRKFRGNDGNLYERDCATIPNFGPDWQALNVKYRIIQPPTGIGKYRYELPNVGGAPLFLCNPEMSLADKPLIMAEGEIKAATVFATLDDPEAVVVGLPGKNVSDRLLAQLKQASDYTIICDPDARVATWKLCKQLGLSRCRVFRPVGKIDDVILATHMTQRELRHELASARPAA